MEVHHHAHTARKKWTHYFWEFIMLFLAVTLGFFVENQREHYIEHQREKQFIRSLANDVRADIRHLETIINNRDIRQVKADSLISLINLPDRAKYGNEIYFNAIHMSRGLGIRLTPHDGTMLQLKNSGGMRLIRKRYVVDSIASYDANVRNLIRLGEVEDVIFYQYRDIAPNIFNGRVFDQMLDENNSASRPSGNPALLSFDQSRLDNLNFSLYSIKLLNKGNRRDAKKLLKQAEQLLTLLEKEYHLE
ncbi:MAG TPA: hypothetical protein VFZ42_10100 [Chitinophagaceae bacterium]